MVSCVVGIVINSVVASPALGNLRQEISTFETLRSAHCLSEASLHALVLKVEILANFLQPVYFSLLRFFSYKRKEMKRIFTSKREMKRTLQAKRNEDNPYKQKRNEESHYKQTDL